MDRVNVFAPSWEISNSYGRLAIQLADGVEIQGLHANRLGLSQPPDQHIKLAVGGFLLAIPESYHLYGGIANVGPRVALTMLETTRIPLAWAERLNQCHAVIVPAQFCVESFRASGVTVPIHVIPLGIDNNFKVPKQRTYEDDEPFRVLVIADRGERKNWYSAIQMFLGAFGNDERYQLTLKTQYMPASFSNPNITVIEDKLTDAGMLDLYHQHHVMLFPTKGEGFGYPPREFAATGGVAIATNWSGTADDIQHWGIPLNEYTFEPGYPQDEMFTGQCGDWCVPDLGEGIQALSNVESDYANHAWRAMFAAEYVAARYQAQTFANECLQVYIDTVKAFQPEAAQ